MTDLGFGRLLLAIFVGPFLTAGPSVAAPADSCQAQVKKAEASESVTPRIGVAVQIFAPTPGQRISGVSDVSGTARSTVPLSRVELVVAGSVVASQDLTPAKTVGFNLRWDAKSAKVGHNALEVLVCGVSAHGATSVEVTVPPRRPIWVGLVAGAAGAAGLVLSSAFGPKAVTRLRRSAMSGSPERSARP